MQNEWTASAAQLKPCLKNSLVWRQELSCEDELLNVLQNTPKRQHIRIFPLKWANFIIHRYRKRVAAGRSSSVPPHLSLYLTIFLSLLHTFLVAAPTEFLRFIGGSDESLAQQFLRGFRIPPFVFHITDVSLNVLRASPRDGKVCLFSSRAFIWLARLLWR